MAATLNRSETLHFLGFVNLVLSSATAESHLTNKLEPARDVQHWLFREVVSAKLLADLKARFRDASLLDRPILHRTQLLFAIRLVATHGSPDRGNRLVERIDFDIVGDLLFLINGLFKVPPPTSKAAEALWLATEMGSLHELENPPPIDLTWPRTEDLACRTTFVSDDQSRDNHNPALNTAPLRASPIGSEIDERQIADDHRLPVRRQRSAERRASCPPHGVWT